MTIWRLHEHCLSRAPFDEKQLAVYSTTQFGKLFVSKIHTKNV